MCVYVPLPDTDLLIWWLKSDTDIAGHWHEIESLLSNFKASLSVFARWDYKTVERLILSQARIVFSTVNGAGSTFMQNQDFSMVVIDEAAQLIEAETGIVLQESVRKLILVGDVCQLPALVLSVRNLQAGYGRSLFERLEQNGHPSILLDEQYRMHPSISLWPNQQFYQERLKDGPNVCVTDWSWNVRLPGTNIDFGPLMFVDNPMSSESRNEQCSVFNESEVQTVMELIRGF